ncbi:bacteriocin fulvocin C-related protein [Microtetraspora malaysiensis]|uniref:bacteriocin fulvocin C-related protein n=1 Tax=Microtetraspora malaysiensis TaxID=161358 RepID=UPI003D8B84C4
MTKDSFSDETYDDFIARSLQDRRAIYAELSPMARSRLWMEQLSRYRATHPTLTEDQERVLGEIQRIVSKEATFARFHSEDDRDQELDQLSQAAIEAFGKDEARKLFATLGPE